MDDFSKVFEDRLQEIETYLDLLDTLEKQVQQGLPKIGTTTITVQQQKILYSSVYLQLYNLVEATITKCIDAITSAVINSGTCMPGDLSTDLRREWVRYIARTHTELNHENRLKAALHLCDLLVQALPISFFEIEKGGGGNWDDLQIQNITTRLGLSLQISQTVYTAIKRPFRNDVGPLAFIKNLRNNLAHGTLSFVECGDGVTAHDLRDLTQRTSAYLREVVASFKSSIEACEFLIPERRPA